MRQFVSRRACGGGAKGRVKAGAIVDLAVTAAAAAGGLRRRATDDGRNHRACLSRREGGGDGLVKGGLSCYYKGGGH